jgi:octaprenyl-diphosphate synthase
MWQMGENIGMAFQIKDDLFDFQLNNKTGKPAGNDIQEKKMTIPLIYALNHTDKKTAREIKKIINKKQKNNIDIKKVVDFVNSSDGIKYATEKMVYFKNKALDIINTFPESEYKNSIIELINYTSDRKK